MKKNKLLIVLLPLVFFFVSACDDYISNVDPVIDLAQDDLLNTEAQMEFLSKGVQQRFATTADQLACLMDLQSDAMIYTGKIATASFPTFEEIDKGAILPDNATVQGVFQAVGQLRKYADDLVVRVGKVSFTSDSKRISSLYTGYLYGGIARFYMAIAFGLNQNEPGGVIDAGPFIPQSALLDQAVAKMKEALAIQTDAYLKKVANSMIAKAYLAKKDYANAATYAAAGLVSGDKAFEALHNDVFNIYFWGFAGAVSRRWCAGMNGFEKGVSPFHGKAGWKGLPCGKPPMHQACASQGVMPELLLRVQAAGQCPHGNPAEHDDRHFACRQCKRGDAQQRGQEPQPAQHIAGKGA